MFSRIPLLLFLCSILGTALFSQAPAAKRLQSLDTKQTTFIEGKTLVKEVLFSGLDEKYEGLGSAPAADLIYEDDLRYALRHGGTTLRPNGKLSSEEVGTAIGIVKEFLFKRGYFSAKVVAFGKELARNEMAVIISVERGPKGEVVGVRFQGMKIFAEEELTTVLKLCLGSAWGKYDLSHLNYCAQRNVREYLWEHGYFQSKLSAPQRKFGKETVEITFQVNEGIRYRFGEMSIEGNKILSDSEILEMLDISKGKVASAKNLRGSLEEKVSEFYRDRGFLEMSWDFEPTFIAPIAEGLDGIVNIKFEFDEGPQFRLGRVEFIGVGDEIARELNSDFPLKREDIYDQKAVAGYIKKLNDSGRFKPIRESDMEILTPVESDESRTDGKLVLKPPRRERSNDVDLRIKITPTQN